MFMSIPKESDFERTLSLQFHFPLRTGSEYAVASCQENA